MHKLTLHFIFCVFCSEKLHKLLQEDAICRYLFSFSLVFVTIIVIYETKKRDEIIMEDNLVFNEQKNV